MKKVAYIILPLAFVALVSGIIGGWIRMGWELELPILPTSTAAQHGLLMIGGFLSTLISLERAVLFKSKLVLSIPAINGLSVPFLLNGQIMAALICLIAGSIGYLIINGILTKRHLLVGNILLSVGAVFQVIAHIVYALTLSYPMAFAGWMLYLLFTIVGERLNLSRFLPVTQNQYYALYLWLGTVLTGSLLYHTKGSFLVGVGLIGIAQWLLRNDIIGITINKKGHYRFLAYSLLLGYSWLAITGIVSFLPTPTPNLYDALLHSFFIGFILSMILAHAPIIFPSLLHLSFKPFHPILFVWLGLLHFSLLARLLGDFSSNIQLRKIAGLTNGVAFLAYLLSIIFLIINQLKHEKSNKVRRL